MAAHAAAGPACAAGLRSGQGLERRPAFPPASSASAQKATLCAQRIAGQHRHQGAQIGGSCAPGRRPVLVVGRNSVRESGRRRIAGSGMGRCLRLSRRDMRRTPGPGAERVRWEVCLAGSGCPRYRRAELAPGPGRGCAWSVTQAALTWRAACRMGSSQGWVAAIWRRVTTSPGRTRPGCTTWAFIPRSRSCLPRLELTKRMASVPKRPANFAQPRCGASLT